jgi:hypothetical protein
MTKRKRPAQRKPESGGLWGSLRDAMREARLERTNDLLRRLLSQMEATAQPARPKKPKRTRRRQQKPKGAPRRRQNPKFKLLLEIMAEIDPKPFQEPAQIAKKVLPSFRDRWKKLVPDDKTEPPVSKRHICRAYQTYLATHPSK